MTKMIEPEIAKLLELVDNRFTLCSVVSKRARQLTDMAKPLRDGDKTFSMELEQEKPVPTATFELYDGRLTYTKPADKI